jgi:hypothetical protein
MPCSKKQYVQPFAMGWYKYIKKEDKPCCGCYNLKPFGEGSPLSRQFELGPSPRIMGRTPQELKKKITMHITKYIKGKSEYFPAMFVFNGVHNVAYPIYIENGELVVWESRKVPLHCDSRY